MSSAPEKKIILITGATNGIGLDSTIFLLTASANYHVIMAARNPTKAAQRVKEVQEKNLQGTVSSVQIDYNYDDSIFAAVKTIEEKFGRVDVLINNAGICVDGPLQWPARNTLRATFETNVYGPTILTEALIPLLKASKDPRIINVTTGLGSIGGLSPHLDKSSVLNNFKDVRVPAYRMSKAALNMLTAYQFHQLREFGFKVWAYCPGWVVTDLGNEREKNSQSPYCESSETSAQGIVEIVRGDRDGEVGGYITKKGGSYPW